MRRLRFAEKFEEWLSPEVVKLLISDYAKPGPGSSLKWEYASLSNRLWGRYDPKTKTLQVNKTKTKDLFKQQVQTLLHEIQHWNQHVKWLSENGNPKENIFTGPSFAHAIVNAVKSYGYWQSPHEVDARSFAAKHLEDAITAIGRHYGGKTEGTWDDVMRELVEVAEEGPMTRKTIGETLRAYDMNSPENLTKAITDLKTRGIVVAPMRMAKKARLEGPVHRSWDEMDPTISIYWVPKSDMSFEDFAKWLRRKGIRGKVLDERTRFVVYGEA